VAGGILDSIGDYFLCLGRVEVVVVVEESSEDNSERRSGHHWIYKAPEGCVCGVYETVMQRVGLLLLLLLLLFSTAAAAAVVMQPSLPTGQDGGSGPKALRWRWQRCTLTDRRGDAETRVKSLCV